MYTVALRDEIRTWVLIQCKSQREAARHFGLSCNTVAIILALSQRPTVLAEMGGRLGVLDHVSSSFVATPARERHLALLGQATGDGRDLGAHLRGKNALAPHCRWAVSGYPRSSCSTASVRHQWPMDRTGDELHIGLRLRADGPATNSTQYKLGTPDIRLYLLWIYSPGEGDHWVNERKFRPSCLDERA